ncbi:type IV secretion system protein VirB8 [Agrobacterium tumefaciens]|uniref:Riorf160 protein n=2 Tax=Rhizobium/Agrobacterium group TaxID=227290 RepID=Q9F595_RHIRH|nr:MULTISPECIES: type IV secretion system protein VirB8 [Rhizobium/Agrobacterium group]ASK42877.1 type IV secretion system protein VirB8 [Rhizobium rhizogenes]MCZ7976384.1 type IV secretion system protein VirB8 [Agrobacterium salinitolerans]MDA5243272.1 type IV secretion system protein VirB8 [Agrobacterium sp. MAFF310724]MDA5247546.1 type IV secretion system protein VirB8 [Agrobacterium sp. MAFF210268]TRB03226.1 type IV secretion system protein VirB8 [Agrobacterium tumefaciens]
MNGSEYALLVEREALADHYKEVEAFQSARARSARRISRALAALAVIAVAGNVAQAFAIAVMLPLNKLVPVYLWVRPDGTVDSEVSISRLPATQEQAVVNASLWEYVRLRESYSADTAQYAYDLVSSFSAPTVRQDYQQFFNYPSPSSPQTIIGKRGKLEAEHIGSNELMPGVQQIRYKRTLIMEGQAPIVTTWTATVHYETVTNLPGRLRLTNPGGLIVTSYQTSEDTVSNTTRSQQ